MARKPDWQSDIDEMKGHERWALRGPLSLIKVKPIADAVVTTVGGYFTTANSIGGLDVPAMEGRLGFEPGHFKSGVRIYTFARLPARSEYTYELTTKFPDGFAYVAWSSDPHYPPGVGHAHQWCIRPGVGIPVLPVHVVLADRSERYRAPT